MVNMTGRAENKMFHILNTAPFPDFQHTADDGDNHQTKTPGQAYGVDREIRLSNRQY
jgi:hypothetical protein